MKQASFVKPLLVVSVWHCVSDEHSGLYKWLTVGVTMYVKRNAIEWLAQTLIWRQWKVLPNTCTPTTNFQVLGYLYLWQPMHQFLRWFLNAYFENHFLHRYYRLSQGISKRSSIQSYLINARYQSLNYVNSISVLPHSGWSSGRNSNSKWNS